LIRVVVDSARLRALPLFDGLAENEVDAVASMANELTAESGSTVVAQDDFGYALYLVEEGDAVVIQDGKQVAALGRGDVFGELGLLVTGRRTASVVASTPLKLLALFDSDYRRLERELPELARRVRTRMAGRSLRAEA
jgi:voltage-gated potassium channel